jgi:hypothetical protein
VTNVKPPFAFHQRNRDHSWNQNLKKYLFEWARCRKAIGGIYFTKEWRAETLHHGLEFDNFKPWLKSSIFKWISWLNGSLFERDDRGFLKEGLKFSILIKLLFWLHIFSLWTDGVNTYVVWRRGRTELPGSQFSGCEPFRWELKQWNCFQNKTEPVAGSRPEVLPGSRTNDVRSPPRMYIYTLLISWRRTPPSSTCSHPRKEEPGIYKSVLLTWSTSSHNLWWNKTEAKNKTGVKG